ncbi:MAG: 2'-5' RNA ligase [uncultured Rubrobacteraceae bacterium]|uniref:RNA 2',3'-cyclic phosphodiesterase n=1 Tax=uncultured Rubrobacteraceae bacterium TaxID=349277 RepID=A0A6J4TYK0_9ACTN|nr:MAG: 2'-5' RNA ligase [uncultured Rubrobacteraceae bacterium]
MRVFVAVFPPSEVQKALMEAARAFPANAFRLTPPERVHLTLKFLGEVPPGDLPRLASALGRAARQGEPFDAVVSGFGAFPSTRRARILWAGIGAGAEGFRALKRAVEDLLEPEGFVREGKPFVPHLTLGRARRPVPLEPGGADVPDLGFAVGALDLVESRQDGSGVTYAVLAKFPLGGP